MDRVGKFLGSLRKQESYTQSKFNTNGANVAKAVVPTALEILGDFSTAVI